ncbi:MAG TPA: hypothetical protein VMS99_06470 [Acidimicrobiia bacterium]|nr:hypothetical protein [Acidimicrobiia bacterium]
MISAGKVVVDGLEASQTNTERPPWGWLVAGLLIGIGVTVLAFRAEDGRPLTETTIAAQDSADSSGRGVAGVIDGFPDGLVTTVRADGRSLELLVWPLRGELYQRAIPVGAANPPNPVVFDRSGRRLATILPLPDEPFGVLYAGVPENAAIVEVDVTGFAWHDSIPSALAFTTNVDDEMLLWVTGASMRNAELRSRSVGIEGGVVAFGDWGYALQDERRNSIVLLTDNGEIKDSHPGRVIASHESGWLAIDDEGLKLLSAGGGIRGVLDSDLVTTPMTAEFSPDRRMLAVLSLDGVGVVSLDDGLEVARSDRRPGVAAGVVWTSDGRFVAYPGTRGLIVVDTSSGEVNEILGDRIITGLGILPLSGT